MLEVIARHRLGLVRADLKHALHLLRENAGRASGGYKEFGLMLDRERRLN